MFRLQGTPGEEAIPPKTVSDEPRCGVERMERGQVRPDPHCEASAFGPFFCNVSFGGKRKVSSRCRQVSGVLYTRTDEAFRMSRDVDRANDSKQGRRWLPNTPTAAIFQNLRSFTNGNLLYVSLQLQATAHGPVVAMKCSLYQRSHDAAHYSLITTAVPLPIMLHPKPVRWDTLSALYRFLSPLDFKGRVQLHDLVGSKEAFSCQN